MKRVIVIWDSRVVRAYSLAKKYNAELLIIQVNNYKSSETQVSNINFNIIFFSLLDSDWLKSVPINP